MLLDLRVLPPGTIVLLSGDGGTSFFNFPLGGSNGVSGKSYVGDYYAAGYNTVQVAWAGNWQDNSLDPLIKSARYEACRPATLLHYIYQTYVASTGKPMCAQGHSGGSAQIAFAMSAYGADKNSTNGYLDTVLLTSGPGIADTKSGCSYDPLCAPLSKYEVCGNGKCVGGQANNCNDYKGARGGSTSTYDQNWSDMSIVNTLGVDNYNYGQTYVYAYLCHGPDTYMSNGIRYTKSNNTAAQGWTYLSMITTAHSQNGNTSTPLLYRVDNCTDPEMIWGINALAEGTGNPLVAGFTQSENDMKTNCQNPHPN